MLCFIFKNIYIYLFEGYVRLKQTANILVEGWRRLEVPGRRPEGTVTEIHGGGVRRCE